MAYAARTDIENIFGARNVITWADLDGDHNEAVIAQRVTAALAYAEADVESVMRATGRFVLPLGTIGGDVPPLLRDIVATLAGVWLYEARGVEQIDAQTGEPLHKLEWKRTWAYRMLEEVRTGQRDIQLVKAP